MYKIKSFSIKTWNNNDVEAIKYDGKKWTNEKQLETALGYKNLASNKTQFYSDEFKKMNYLLIYLFNSLFKLDYM